MMELTGYGCAILVGLSLGLLGGGGSILAVPIFYYIFRLPAAEATTYSLFTVGASSVAGTLRYLEQKLVCFPALIVFGIPSVITGYLTRRYFVHSLPESMPLWGDITLDKDFFIMVLFALLMLIAGRAMIKSRDFIEAEEIPLNRVNIPFTLLAGIVTGWLTSIVGAGGGFLIIPVLVRLFRLPVKRAIGTSLALIVLNSLIGFSGDVSADRYIDWLFLMKFTGLSLIGIFLGVYLSHHVSGDKLKPAFGWFVLGMSALILLKETLLS